MLNKITGLKLEEICKFDLAKFQECIVEYNGRYSEGKGFTKKISINQIKELYNSIYNIKETNPEILITCPKELFLDFGKDSYANIVAKGSEYTLIRDNSQITKYEEINISVIKKPKNYLSNLPKNCFSIATGDINAIRA